MTTPQTIIRRAIPSEADTIAEISRSSRQHFLPYLPDLHSLEEDRNFFRNRVFAECEVWVAEENQHLTGFCAFKPGWIDHLYLRPSHVGHSLGTALLNKAKSSHPHLQLWVFQQNQRAIRFYEREGFHKIKETDGSTNEEKTPDALFEWRRPT